jgi:linalool 8-monooxygenase
MNDRQPSRDNMAKMRRSSIDPDNHLDTKNPDVHINDGIFAIFQELRQQGPVVWNPEVNGRGFWAVLGRNEVAEVLKNPETFSASWRNGGSRIFDVADVTNTPSRLIFALDPPERTDIRQAISGWFTPSKVAATVPAIRLRAERLIAAIAERGQADFVAEVSYPYSIGLATDLMGLEESFGPILGNWIEVLLGDDDPDVMASLEVRRQTIAEFDAWALEIFEGKLRPKTNLLEAVRRVSVGQERLSFDDFSVNVLGLATAFSETTRHALSYAILALDADPVGRARLIADPSLASVAAKEVMRWTSPIAHTRRTAMCDVELGGARIRKGDKVVLWITAGNRDPAHWSRPEQVDLARFGSDAPAHISFGAGPSFCLGWRYAELEITIMLETLVRRLPDIRQAGSALRLKSNFVRAIRSLPVEFTPSIAAGG